MHKPPGFTLLLLALTSASLSGCRGESAEQKAEAAAAREEGLTLLQRDQLAEAEERFRRVVALTPKDASGHANLGLTYLRAGRLADAEAPLERARDLAPDNAEIALMAAKLYALTGRTAEARELLQGVPRGGASDARLLHALAELEWQRDTTSRRYEDLLRQVQALKPANLAVRFELLDIAMRGAQSDSALRQLEEIRRLPPALPADATALLEQTVQHLRAGRQAEALAAFDRLRGLVEVTAPYQQARDEVKWVDAPLMGRPILTFQPQSVLTMRGTGVLPAAVEQLRFTDVTAEAGLPEPLSGAGAGQAGAPAAVSLAVGDYDGDGSDDLFAASRLYHVRGGYVVDVTDKAGLSGVGATSVADFADFDNDGWLDLFLIEGNRGRLLRNTGKGTFEDATARAGGFDGRGAVRAAAVDLDHDGDLDLLLVGGERRLVYRNNLDGTFTESAEAMGLGGRGDARSVRFADFDDDGRIDLLVAFAGAGTVLLKNVGGRRFSDATAASGLPAAGGSGAVAVGDYDNDGDFDVFVAAGESSEAALWRNRGDGTFTRDAGSSAALRATRSLRASDAGFLDADNDGWLDLLVVGATSTGSGRGAAFLRNDGRGAFADRSSALPASLTAAAVVPSDVDDDGDLDLLMAGPQAARMLRNEGGNTLLASKIQLNALRTGSGKNNTFGIGSRIELRAGEIYQTRVATGRQTHFGLGPHLKGDVLRVQWPNGVPQTVYFPGSDQDVLELERLKGSCAFLYTWDGKGFRFVTDVMWRSALGMPLGIMGAGTMAYAPAGASQEYLRIPGTALQPRNGRYILQFTEELWETAYADEIRLLAVDHPDSIDVFVDERFVPPAPIELRLFKVVRPRVPLSATDERGADVLPALRHADAVYVSNLTPVQYQGVVEPHDLVLDLGPDAGAPGTVLFLRGWIYPSDASINVALSQRADLRVMMPSLEVRDARGRWTTAIPNIGFPSGKDKTIAIELAGKFPTADHRVRIRTNMQIYWDQAVIATETTAPVRIVELPLVSADLHFRGYSREYRNGGRYGPHWFAYDSVSREHPWRPIEGAFTRFGNVLPLLTHADDMYVVMAPGDEATVTFDATAGDPAPRGWRRDFLLYTDGWIKDADMNTAFGNTVEPLPFHSIREYPYAAGDAYPADSAHQRYLREYNTRIVRRHAKN